MGSEGTFDFDEVARVNGIIIGKRILRRGVGADKSAVIDINLRTVEFRLGE